MQGFRGIFTTGIPDKGLLKEFLLKNRAEVLGMLLEEFDAEKYERTIREEGREEGRKEGRAEEREESFRRIIELLQEADFSRDAAKEKVMQKYVLSEDAAEGKFLLYWKQ